jgi:exodeoxyribonuclease VII large subunit
MATTLFPPTNGKILTVGELTRSLKEVVETAYDCVWVEGEVSNLARPNSGHQYLTLKDDEAPIKAMIYRGSALRMRFDLRNGMRIIVRGRLTLYMPRGEYQLLIEEVHPKGIGPLELAFRQLKEKLSIRGYFEPGRKKPLPRIPRRVVLVTSGTGSAVRDMLEVLSRRWPAVEVWICPVRVQGEGAAAEIADSLGFINRLRPADGVGIEVLILGRGGGSLEDLWPFNEECVAQAIFSSRIPVVTGIGHEDDLTIADMVADCRALTPSEAAERIVPDRAKVLEWLGDLEARLLTLLHRRVEQLRVRVDVFANRGVFRNPLERIRTEERRLDELVDRMNRAIQKRAEQGQQKLEALAAQLDTLSPLNVLNRGYSLTSLEANRELVRSSESVRTGQRIVTRLRRGQIVSRVEETRNETRPSANEEDSTHV